MVLLLNTATLPLQAWTPSVTPSVSSAEVFGVAVEWLTTGGATTAASNDIEPATAASLAGVRSVDWITTYDQVSASRHAAASALVDLTPRRPTWAQRPGVFPGSFWREDSEPNTPSLGRQTHTLERASGGARNQQSVTRF